MTSPFDPLLYLTPEQFAYLQSLAGILCGFIVAYALMDSL